MISLHFIFICIQIFSFFRRVPCEESRRKQWMDAINEQQSPGQNIQYRSICCRHFPESDFKVKQFGQKILKSSAVPTIFNDQNRYDSKRRKQNSPANLAGDIIDVSCSESVLNLNTKIAELENKIANMKINHDLEKQVLEKKIESLSKERKKLAIQLTTTRKEFSKEKEQKNCLTNIIEELKAERFISPDDVKFLEVCEVISYDLGILFDSNIYKKNIYFFEFPYRKLLR